MNSNIIQNKHVGKNLLQLRKDRSPEGNHKKYQKKLQKMNEAIQEQKYLNQQLAHKVAFNKERGILDFNVTEKVKQNFELTIGVKKKNQSKIKEHFSDQVVQSQLPISEKYKVLIGENIRNKILEELISPNQNRRQIKPNNKKRMSENTLDLSGSLNLQNLQNIKDIRRRMSLKQEHRNLNIESSQQRSKSDLINDIINITLPKNVIPPQSQLNMTNNINPSQSEPVSPKKLKQFKAISKKQSIEVLSRLSAKRLSQSSSNKQFVNLSGQTQNNLQVKIQQSLKERIQCGQVQNCNHNHHQKKDFNILQNTFDGHRIDDFCMKQQKLLEQQALDQVKDQIKKKKWFRNVQSTSIHYTSRPQTPTTRSQEENSIINHKYSHILQNNLQYYQNTNQQNSIQSTMRDVGQRWQENDYLQLNFREVANAMLNYKYSNKRQFTKGLLKDINKPSKFMDVNYWRNKYLLEERQRYQKILQIIKEDEKLELHTQVKYNGIKGLAKLIKSQPHYFSDTPIQILKRKLQWKVMHTYTQSQLVKIDSTNLTKPEMMSIFDMRNQISFS
eukprot:403361162